MQRFIAALIAMFICSLNVHADEFKKCYISVKAGVALMEFDNARYYSTIGGDQTHEYDRSSDDSVFFGGLGFGMHVNKYIRTEIEYLYRSNFEYDKKPTNTGIANAHQELKTQSLMAHIFYDFQNNTRLTPFVFAGAGIAYHRTDADANLNVAPFFTYKGSESDTKFAWDLGIGAGYAITDNINIDLSYRYSCLGEAEWVNNRTDGGDNGGSFADISANEFFFTVRYAF